MYRVFRDLASGHKAGDILLRGDIRDESIEILLGKKLLKEVESPPIQMLPGWEERAETLKKYNITSVEEFIYTGENLLRFIFREPPELIKGWKKEIINYLK